MLSAPNAGSQPQPSPAPAAGSAHGCSPTQAIPALSTPRTRRPVAHILQTMSRKKLAVDSDAAKMVRF